MTAPTSPYCTSAQVSQLLQVLYKGAVPSASTTPDDTDVAFAVTGTAAIIEMAFRRVGYKIPFVILTGETWPASQTGMLTWFNVVGAAGTVGGKMLRPAPAISPGRSGGRGNVYQEQFDNWIEQLVEGGGGAFRADYYAGSDAEHHLNEPRAPLMAHTEGAYDPVAGMTTMDALVAMLETQRKDFEALGLDWDWIATKRSAVS